MTGLNCYDILPIYLRKTLLYLVFQIFNNLLNYLNFSGICQKSAIFDMIIFVEEMSNPYDS